MLSKIQIHEYCIQVLEDKLQFARQNVTEIRESILLETKSTAGDKHETSRAMAQLELDKASKQIHELELIYKALINLNPNQHLTSVVNGALIHTNHGYFYLSIPMGKVTIENYSITVLSPASPLGKLFLSKKNGDAFLFNNTAYQILEIK